ncbi:MAG: hypothetical protein U5J82_10670 [Desulfobacterales bacterium]|nr:hypothetical protein [Desulfobacterales bacterium]
MDLTLEIGEIHWRCTRRINFRESWREHLWQGRFSPFIMEERYLLACARYVELNPVRSGLAKKSEDWRWSSAAAERTDRAFEAVSPLLKSTLTGVVYYLL